MRNIGCSKNIYREIIFNNLLFNNVFYLIVIVNEKLPISNVNKINEVLKVKVKGVFKYGKQQFF